MTKHDTQRLPNQRLDRGAKIMRRMTTLLFVAAFSAAGFVPGCAEPGPEIDRTQANLVDKSIFEGEWWYMRTVVGIDDDAAWAINSAGASAPWPGAMASYDLASRSGVMGRIRWVIDERFLFAYRSHEIVMGAAANADDDGFLGEPLAVFPITGHVDVRRDYNPVTGEPSNVISESADRRWYDRQYLRVDWSTNLVSFGMFGASLELEGLFTQFRREPVTNFVQEGGDGRTPEDWRPQFVRIGDNPDYRFAAEWPAEMNETVHYMSFVTNELWTPLNCFNDVCSTSLRISLRNAFLRIPPNHEYAVETLPNSEYDRFGIIRTEQRTYVRGGNDRESVSQYCDAVAVATCDFSEDCGTDGQCTAGACVAGVLEDLDDCGAGGMADYATGRCQGNIDSSCGGSACDLATHMCTGGLTADYGETDRLTFYRLRHNFYSDSLDETRPCSADWQCDNRYGTAGGTPDTTDGSVCDQAAAVCTVPLRNRPVRAVNYHLSPHYPQHLVRSSFDVVSQWNHAFMNGQRALTGRAQPVPSSDRQACQSVDPTEYCFCGAVTAAEVSEGTCAYRSNFFVAPDARGEADPYDCWIAMIDDGIPVPENETINPAAPTSYDDYDQNVYRYAFVGDECMMRLNVNSCDRPVEEGEAPAECEALGDIRYQFFNYATGAGAGWCGVMQQVQDPTTGEAISIPINMGGLCLDLVGSTAVELWPVLRGEVSEDTLYSGENMRGYYERLGNVHVPVGIANTLDGADYDPDDPSRPSMPVDINAHINDVFAQLAPRFENLGSSNEGGFQRLSGRLRTLEGTSLEHRLVEGMRQEGLNALGAANPIEALNMESLGAPSPTSEEVIDRISPFREGAMDMVLADHLRETALSNNYIEYPRDALYTSRYNQYWADAFEGRPLTEANIRWRQGFLRAVMLHEMGHGLGLEHNFAGSYDRDQYQDGYFGLVTREDSGGNLEFALPTLDEFDCGVDGLCPGDPGHTVQDNGEADTILTDNESNAWAAEVRRVRTARSLAGAGNYMTSTIMEYPGDMSDMSGLGRYDHAAVYFNYFNLAEAYQGNPAFSRGASTSLEGLHRSDITPRTLWTWYRGGETCDVNTDCPFASGSGALTDAQGIHQRCIRNPRYSNIPLPCEGDRNCICSNFDEDFIDYTEGAEPSYGWDCGADGQCQFLPGTRSPNPAWTAPDAGEADGISEHERVEYLFCSNSRLGDISWCNTFDAGESFQESIDHFRQVWQEGYPRNYFRNYRRGFSSGARSTRYIVDAAKIYQHLFFRYFNEPEFQRETGPLGFNDQYLASIDAMNWLAELAQLPAAGSYALDLVTDSAVGTCDPTDAQAPSNAEDCRYAYRHMGEEMDMPGSVVNLEPGEGYHHWSRYQDGLYGFFRLERGGVFWDKYIALLALTIRDWGLSFSIDERYFINFYDLFPIEMTELFGGYVVDDPQWYAPRMRVNASGDPEVYYLNYFRGQCRDASGALGTCRPSNAEAFTDPPILGTSNEILRLYASIFALAEFPVYYDPSFESRLAVFKLDNTDGFTIPDTQLDGLPTRHWGGAIPGSGHAAATTPEDADYISYHSDRLNTTYIAVKVRERPTFNLEEEQLGFQLLLRLARQQEQIELLEDPGVMTPPEPAVLLALRRELLQGETFVEALIEVQRTFGITSFF